MRLHTCVSSIFGCFFNYTQEIIIGSLSKDSSAGILVLLAFMNNPGAVKTIKLLCNLVPAAAIFLDALSTTKKL